MTSPAAAHGEIAAYGTSMHAKRAPCTPQYPQCCDSIALKVEVFPEGAAAWTISPDSPDHIQVRAVLGNISEVPVSILVRSKERVPTQARSEGY